MSKDAPNVHGGEATFILHSCAITDNAFCLFAHAFQTSGCAESSCTMQTTMNFPSEMGDIHVDSLSAIRRFEEPQRIVLAYTTLLAPLGTGLLFRENGWLIITRPTAAESSPALLQSCHRLYLQKRDSSSRSASEIAYLHNFFLNTQGESVRAQHLHVQSMLLRQFDSISTDPFSARACASNVEHEETTCLHQIRHV